MRIDHSKTFARAAAILLALLVLSGSRCPDLLVPPLPDDISVEVVATGLTVPVFLTTPAKDRRLFVVEQTGRIRVIRDGQLLATPYLDLSNKVICCGERGLLGMAFHPDFASNGFFYVNYTGNGGHTVIERYRAARSADTADASSATLVLGFNQPFANHNGGMLAFGPDGMLWIGTGDGGSGGDPQNNGQTLTTLLGKMLRIDVNVPGAGYRIPSSNPFAINGPNRPEIWGWGLRNPWRYSFDRLSGLLYLGDVGQNVWEEVHAVRSTESSVNFGWRIMEGNHCFPATVPTCDSGGLNIPVHEYDHSQGCAVIGGYVYKGRKVPRIRGRYFYSDSCTSFLRSFRMELGGAVEHMEWDVGALGSVSSFGEDSSGELYILSRSTGTVFRLTR